MNLKKVYLLALTLCICLSANAQLVINEYSASNLESFPDAFNRFEDWIELYNGSDQMMDISGYYISDKEDNPTKWRIPDGTNIEANGFLVLYCSGRDLQFNGDYHTNFKLAQTKGNEFVVLADPSGNIMESYALELTLVEHSRCRVTDGSPEWAISTDPTHGSSNNTVNQVNGYTVAPSIDLAAGYYDTTQVVSIINNEPNSRLLYTLDGTNPTESSPEYIDPIVVTETMVVKAQSFSNDPMILPGKMTFNTYFINEDFSLAVFSVAADDVLELAAGQGELIPIGSLEYFNTNKEREAISFGSLNRHGQDSWVLDHRSLDWISRDEMGYSKAVQAPLFGYSDRDEYQKFMFRNSGDDNYPAIEDQAHEGSTHIRDEFVQTLSLNGGMKLDTRAVERVVLFLNGQYWGVYGMRERPVDHDYTDEYYDQGKYEIQYLSTWGNTEIEYGGTKALTDWVELRNFALSNDLGDTSNYKIVEDSINLTSLIDYMVVNLNVVASDWLNYNTGWWRGLNPEGDHKKWGYILWDLDATFDYYINYSGVPNISPDADPCDLEEIGEFMDGFFGGGPGGGGGQGTDIPAEECLTIENGTSPYPATDTIFVQVIGQDAYCCETDWDQLCQSQYDDILIGDTSFNGSSDVGQHEKIFLKLLEESEVFKQLYYSRYADLMNTVYTCDNMLTTLDSMLAVIEPEMPKQIERWGGSMEEWEANVQRLKDFIGERCTLLDDGMIECYEELNGPYDITLMATPAGIGEIDFNTLDIESFPWTGSYFGGMENKIKARVFDEYEDDYVFSHWESSAGNIIFPNSETRKATISLSQADTLTAVFTILSDVEEIDNSLFANVYPNPASDHLILEYELKSAAPVEVNLLNTQGQNIAQFITNQQQARGSHSHKLDISSLQLSSGLYMLKLRAGNEQKTMKVNIIR